jgi:hypothetical protein
VWRQPRQEKVSRFLKAQICCVMLTPSRARVCSIASFSTWRILPTLPLSVLPLQQFGYKIVSTQVTPSNCPIQNDRTTFFEPGFVLVRGHLV